MSESENTADVLHRWLPDEHGIVRAALAITQVEVRWHQGECVLTVRPADAAPFTAVLPPEIAAHLAQLLMPPGAAATARAGERSGGGGAMAAQTTGLGPNEPMLRLLAAGLAILICDARLRAGAYRDHAEYEHALREMEAGLLSRAAAAGGEP